MEQLKLRGKISQERKNRKIEFTCLKEDFKFYEKVILSDFTEYLSKIKFLYVPLP